MKTKAIILDKREEAESTCFLCKINLEDYVNGLPETYQEYDVQREIVSNVYLDHLVDTVLDKRHIPPIVLVLESEDYNLFDQFLEINRFKILDGLQRTFRLQAIKKTIAYCLEYIPKSSIKDELIKPKFKFSRDFSEKLRNIESNTSILRSILEKRDEIGDEKLRSLYSESYQWFEIWTGLTAKAEVQKMLTLNAGHKPVKTRHQLEILFLNLLPYLRTGLNSKFKLVREKDISATQFSKSREIGNFHFAHLITAILSLSSGSPVTPTTNLIQGIQENDPSIDEYGKYLVPEFLKEMISVLLNLDVLINEQYGNIGLTWMGREVTLSGIFGAIGKVADEKEETREVIMLGFISILQKSPNVLNLENFEKTRNSLDLSKVNIGNANRSAVYQAIRDLLNNPVNPSINWAEYFL